MPKKDGLRPSGKQKVGKNTWKEEEEKYEETKINGKVASGYLIGRHPECGELLRYRLTSRSTESSYRPRAQPSDHIQ